MEDNTTKGVGAKTEGFIPVGSGGDDSTNTVDYAGGDTYGLRYASTLVKTLEEHFGLTALVVSIIGYIVISAFGHMSSVGEYLGYILFLVTSVTLYRFSESDKVVGIIQKLYIFGFFALLFYILLSNLDSVRSTMIDINGLLK